MAGDSDDIRTRVGSGIKTLRRARGWSQEDLAARAGISYKFIGEIERGRANPTIDTLGTLAKALGVDITALMGAPRGESPETSFRLSRDEFIVVREAKESLESIINRLAPGRSIGRGRPKSPAKSRK